MSKHFMPERWEEFLIEGAVEFQHKTPIPIEIGFIIAQLGELRTQIGVLVTQATPHAEMQAIISELTTANAQLVQANGANAALAQKQTQQIADLQAQLAAGGSITSDDLTALNTIAGQIQQTAASTAGVSGVAAPPAATTAPADSTTTPAAPADSTSTTAPSDPTSVAPAPVAAPSTTAPSTPTTDAAQPVTVDAGDTGASQ